MKNVKFLKIFFFICLLLCIPAGLRWDITEPLTGLATFMVAFAAMIQTKEKKPRAIGVLLRDKEGGSVLLEWTEDAGLAAAIFWKPRLVSYIQSLEVGSQFGLASEGGRTSLKLGEFKGGETFTPWGEDSHYSYAVAVVVWENVFPDGVAFTPATDTVLWHSHKTAEVLLPQRKRKD